MSFRIRPDTKADLAKAAASSGRSLSQEAEHRLRRALDDDRAVDHLIASLMAVEKLKSAWASDAGAFDHALEAIVEALKTFHVTAASASFAGGSSLKLDERFATVQKGKK
jgi:hypothetical protein